MPLYDPLNPIHADHFNQQLAYNRSNQGIPEWLRYLNPGSGGQGTTSGGTGGYGSSPEANRASMYDLLSGRIGALQNDPLDNAISAQLMGRVNGTNVPYDQATRNAYYTNASDQSAAAENAQAARIHGNPSDPSYQAAMRELEANRAGSNQASRLSVDMNANLANYNAQGQAMYQGGAWNAGRQGAITDQSNRLAQTLGNQQFTTQSGGGASMPSFGGWQDYSGQPQQNPYAYVPQQTQQPAPQPAHPSGGDGYQGYNPVPQQPLQYATSGGMTDIPSWGQLSPTWGGMANDGVNNVNPGTSYSPNNYNPMPAPDTDWGTWQTRGMTRRQPQQPTQTKQAMGY